MIKSFLMGVKENRDFLKIDNENTIYPLLPSVHLLYERTSETRSLSLSSTSHALSLSSLYYVNLLL